MFEYKKFCKKCGEEFSYSRKAKQYTSDPIPNNCPTCLKETLSEYKRNNNYARKRYAEKEKNSDGYVVFLVDGEYVSEHRYVMEQMIGRNLKKGESVHHKDGNRANNNPVNLELWLTPQIYGVRASDMICPHCNKPYSKF